VSTRKGGGRSLILLYTGDGKGKTTAALGQALRAAGQGLRVCVVQFVKGDTDTGEIAALRSLTPPVEVHVTGCGFSWQNEPDAVAAHGRWGWELAKAKISSGAYDMVILDEITYLVRWGIVTEEELLGFLDSLTDPPHLVLTGRGAGPALTARADLVTEMKEVKHHFRAGISPARHRVLKARGWSNTSGGPTNPQMGRL